MSYPPEKIDDGLRFLLAYAHKNPVAHQWISALLNILARQEVTHG